MTDSAPPSSTLTPTPQAKTQETATIGLRDLLAPVMSRLVLVFLVGLVSAPFSLLPAIAVTTIARDAIDGTLTASSAWRWVLAVVLGLTVGHLLVLGATGYAHELEASFRTSLRSRIAQHLARLPLGWHTAESSGRTKVLLTEDTGHIHTIIAHLGGDLGSSLGGLVAGFAYLFTQSWQMSLILLVWMILVIAVCFAWSSLTGGTVWTDFMEASKDMGAATVEMVDGISTVKAFGVTGTLFRRFDDALDRYTNASFRYMRGPGRPMALLAAFLSPAGVIIPVLLSGTWLAGRGSIAPIDVLPFLLVGLGLPAALTNLTQIITNSTLGSAAAKRIGALLSEAPLPEAADPVPITPDRDAGGTSVSLEHVSFRYTPEAPLAVDDVSLHLEPGTVTAIVGPSGSGKSTLVRLIARFWDVEAGAVRIGGTDVREASSTDLLSQLSLVLQEGGILTDTVRANIALARPEATDAQIEQAARSANIHERILALPQGYDTVLGSEGAHLSGGEKQRIALARAFLGDAPILLLDEATAQADPHSEREIQQALARLSAGRTVLVIAHRLDTVVDADQIIVMDHGRVVETGTHDELLAAEGLYSTMRKAQQ